MDRIRAATEHDARTIAQIHVEGWRWAYAGLVPEELLRSLSSERREAGWRRDLGGAMPQDHRAWVIERDGPVIGFCLTSASGDGDALPGTGEVQAIYLRPHQVGTGAGRALFAHSVEDLEERGFLRATLWVLQGNDRGERFYRAAGWWFDGTTKDEPLGEFVLRQMRYRTELTRATPPPSSSARPARC